ncbi:hypothetical protein EMIHUDRAFT_220450 [Emiliania huxleyi CCMP1516]|uniref:AAA domain-containing protein n=2 Tax=Emiliania huxleyi TaxID=2903 RepID=A0A0D3I153_EMIH1|nr:hypothetical protein EMIHUDRAFT_220450 [Emiliania huxleyi CCMP1516]EOD04988.1 hypothetical protein EMIHUDRAFT_220450 [Emiliania huxleyi CCMP1516]|eukprot:XP_005757417.1 hypothetical protein EMIHUDRAFT_220450 [Emiliania huxleyi CCMP1516]
MMADPTIHSVFSFKVGVGKTTVTANLAATLAAQGWRVLLVDGDPQANLTGFMTRYGKQEALEANDVKVQEVEDVKVQEEEPVFESTGGSLPSSEQSSQAWWDEGKPGLVEPHKEEADAMNVGGFGEPGLDMAEFLKTVKSYEKPFGTLPPPVLLNGYRKLGLIKGTPNIVDWEKVANIDQVEVPTLGRLRSGLLELGEGFDFILIDLPPAISDLNKLFLTCSDYILMPVACDSYSADTLFQMFKGDTESVLHKMMKYMTKGSTKQAGGINKKKAGGYEDPVTGDFIPRFERSIGLYPVLMNRCQKSKGYQSMHKISTKWYNGFERFLNGVTLPSGFEWVNDSCRVVGAFNESVALSKLQVEKLPVVLSNSLAVAEVTLRDSLLALSSMLIVTTADQLERTNPDLMRVCKARQGCSHGHRGLTASECLGQVPHFRMAAKHMPAELKPRSPLDETLIELVERMVYETKKHTQTIPSTGRSKKTLTFRELLYDQTISEVDVTEHMGAISSTWDGYKLKYVNGRITNGDVDFALVDGSDDTVAKVEAKMIDSKQSTEKDFDVMQAANHNKSLKAIYGIVFEKVEGPGSGAFSDVKQIALYKWTKPEATKPAQPVLFCFIPGEHLREGADADLATAFSNSEVQMYGDGSNMQAPH